MHKSITEDRIIEAMDRYDTSLDNPGFCKSCGHEQDGCEPDARYYICESCNQASVFGAAELLMEIM